MLRTEEIGFGLLPTPTTQEPASECEVNETGRRKTTNGTGSHGLNIGRMAAMGLLPTPTSVQREHPERVDALKATGAQTMFSRANGEQRPNSIIDHLHFHGMLPTPMASDNGDKVTGLENQNSMVKIAREMTGQTSQLNPLFVAEMMGFPTDWTVLPFLNGETNL
jgi:hypothetical protein